MAFFRPVNLPLGNPPGGMRKTVPEDPKNPEQSRRNPQSNLNPRSLRLVSMTCGPRGLLVVAMTLRGSVVLRVERICAYMRGPSLPREEHKSEINSVRRKSGDFKKSPYTPVGPSAKKYRGKEDKKKRRNACNYRNAFPGSLREKTESVRVSCTLSSRATTEGNERRTGGPIGPRGKGNEEKEREKKRKRDREERGSPKSRAAVSLDISALLARWSFSRAG